MKCVMQNVIHQQNVLIKSDIERIRRDFPILSVKVYGRPLIYFDNAATSQKPQSVIDAIEKYYTSTNANVHRGVHFLSQEASKQYDDGRINFF